MEAFIKINNPDKVELSLTLIMTLEGLKALKDEISDRWPGWQFKTIITNMIIKAETHFTSEEKIER